MLARWHKCLSPKEKGSHRTALVFDTRNMAGETGSQLPLQRAWQQALLTLSTLVNKPSFEAHLVKALSAALGRAVAVHLMPPTESATRRDEGSCP